MTFPGADCVRFLRQWLASPRTVGALAPSGGALSALITSGVAADSGPVLELGPGTGVFTRALIDRGVREEDLTLIEYGPAFVAMLEARFPRARVLQLDAARIGRDRLLAPATYGAVISGLPLLNFPLRKTMAILEGAFGLLKPNGAYYQFTYGLGCPVPLRLLDHLGLKARRVGGALSNLPPASVYRISSRHRRTALLPGA
ncbi:MAG: methyltransferase domain-containing protein [Sphingopyxis sp.]|uniref:class I SAM-dependent methyltransferase n=1 Tax=Sphingopyxis sp. TaxID=1908224 RepID=UPI002AB9281B|nr:methyltransferase domain-containing protein [Sphingopyxis sp.]MDZ3833315.1 methyltransferase domain-containing protein [Sphingopyxis sp.]